ncbi:histidine phosphatase family protein [Alkaliphilus transvaalensis]|uniref:histidine phosphatase family protein n=1 Tax=Alkaliphilus transvaalensis TaxID=114628 RepID=UPI00047B74A3|nr:histidine phosphatase family protein [Alkaliphilus transvaalensis]
MKKLYIVRHGETKWNIEGRTQGLQDSALTEKGLRQAELLANRLKTEEIDIIFSSSLDRAKTTAGIIADYLHIPCHYKEELKELGFGKWEGLTLDEIKEHYPKELNDWHYNPHLCKIPEGEDILLVQKRMIQLFNELQHRPEENVLLVSHGAVIKLFLLAFLEMPLNHYYRITQTNCAINIIEFKNKGPVLTKYNDTSYMEILLEGELYDE